VGLAGAQPGVAKAHRNSHFVQYERQDKDFCSGINLTSKPWGSAVGEVHISAPTFKGETFPSVDAAAFNAGGNG